MFGALAKSNSCTSGRSFLDGSFWLGAFRFLDLERGWATVRISSASALVETGLEVAGGGEAGLGGEALEGGAGVGVGSAEVGGWDICGAGALGTGILGASLIAPCMR